MNILVVCSNDMGRAPMFTAILRKRLSTRKGDHRVESVGIIPVSAGQPAAPVWAELRGFTGCDLTGHTSRHVSSVNLRAPDLIVSLDNDVSITLIDEHGVTADKIVTFITSDPHGHGREAYKRCFKEINRHMFAMIREVLRRTEGVQTLAVE